MITAFGYDWVPGNLAGALALSRAGEAAARVDTGYFITGDSGSMSGGTRASLAGVMSAPAFAFRDGRVQSERGARRVRSFRVGSKELSGVSVGSSEHFALPRLAPRLREVNAYLGWFGPASRAMQVFSAGTAAGMKVPGAARLWDAAAARFVKGSTGGPDAAARAKSGSHVVAIAYDASGRELSAGARVRRGRVHVHRQDPGLGRRAGGRGRPPGRRGARPGRRLRPRRARGGLPPGRHRRGRRRIAGQAGRGARRRRLSGRVRLSRDPAARRRLLALAAAAALALAVGDRGGLRLGRRSARTTGAARARPRSRRPTPSPCASRSASCSCRASTARPCRAYMRRRLRAGETAGVILFGGNAGTAGGWRSLTGAVQRAARGGALVAVDQEGGEIRTVPFAGPEPGQPAQGSPARRARAGPRRGQRAERRSA